MKSNTKEIILQGQTEGLSKKELLKLAKLYGYKERKFDPHKISDLLADKAARAVYKKKATDEKYFLENVSITALITPPKKAYDQ